MENNITQINLAVQCKPTEVKLENNNNNKNFLLWL